MDELILLKLVAALGIGIAVGGGIMILSIAKWGKKFFAGEKGEQGIQGIQGSPAPTTCPYASDHPKLQEFMGASLKDRQDMRKFLEEINSKVGVMNGVVKNMEGKLDVLLQGARVRWNGAMPGRDGL